MLGKSRFVTMFAGAVLLSPAFASADHWVDDDGEAAWSACDSDTPLSGPAACSLATANAEATAGDIVNMRSGDYGTIVPANSGANGNPITFRAYPGDPVWTVRIGEGLNIGLDLREGQDHIQIEGLYFYRVDRDWITFPDLGEDIGHGADGADFLWVSRCKFFDANSYAGIRVEGGSDYGVVEDSLFADAPRQSTTITDECYDDYTASGGGSAYESGGACWDVACEAGWLAGEDLDVDCKVETAPADMIQHYGGSYWRYERNSFGRSSHNGFTWWNQPSSGGSKFNIIRDNVFDAGLHRGFGMHTNEDFDQPVTVFEGNLIVDPAQEGNKNSSYRDRERKAGNGMQAVAVEKTIFRHNTIANGRIGISTGSGYASWKQHADHHHFYHNTLYNVWWSIRLGADGGYNEYTGYVFKNNLIVRDEHITMPDPWVWGNMDTTLWHPIVNHGDSNLDVEPVTVFDNNQWPYQAGTTYLFKNTKFSDKTLNFLKSSEGWPDEWLSSNYEAEAFFARSPTKYDPEFYHLDDDQAAVDNATALTEAEGGAAVPSTTLVVLDSFYFCDGFGIPGEEGDLIFLEGHGPARIGSIDYSTHTITLTAGATWADGAGIFFCRHDVCFHGAAPDVGAHEYFSDSVPPAKPTGLEIME